MNESISTSYLVMMIAILISVISVLIITFSHIQERIKQKNKIVDIIEKYDGYEGDAVKAEINQYLKDVGYSVMRKSTNCPKFNGEDSMENNSTYAYCVYEFPTSRGKYYTIHIFVNINLPLVNEIVELKVKGQTRTIYDL